jgi:type IV secretory pathway component VirB8
MEAKKTEQTRLIADDAQLFEPEYSADNNTANNILFAFFTLVIVLAIIGVFGIIYHFIDFWKWILN